MTNWKVPHCVKGRAVRTLCPISGPLSDLEFEALHQATITAFETNEISPEDFLLVALFMATGRRACQLADLKAKDLVEAQSGDGLREFLLNVPRRKQPGIKWRELFRAVALIPEISCVIKTVIEQNRKVFLALFKDINPEALDELPIFPQWSTVRSYVKNTPENVLDALLLGQYFHYKSQFIGPRLKKLIASFNVPSERTGDKLFVLPTRLRRTLATRAAREGYGEYIIAELLDHTDTQCVGIYTENVPEHINAINEAVARQLTPYAQAFAGVLVNGEPSALRGDNMVSRVQSEEGAVGTCGHFGFCGAFSPVACYTCRHFQPWLGAPHREVLAALISERNRIQEITKDATIASINDRTILAVTEVVQQCEKRQAQISWGLAYG